MYAVEVSFVVNVIVAPVVVVVTEGVVMVGAVVSAGASVVAEAEVDCVLLLPALSYADTVYVYEVEGVSEESV